MLKIHGNLFPMRFFKTNSHLNLNNLIWSDSVILSYTHNIKESIFELRIKDYCDNNIIIVFSEIEEVKINDPVYIIKSKELKENDFYILSLWDDDNEAIRIVFKEAQIK